MRTLSFQIVKKKRKSLLDPYIGNIESWLSGDIAFGGTLIYDRLIDAIESSTPKKHLDIRETFCYKYRSIGPYKKPLLLLQTISENKGALHGENSCAKDLFDQIKAFKELKDRLSPEDALKVGT